MASSSDSDSPLEVSISSSKDSASSSSNSGIGSFFFFMLLLRSVEGSEFVVLGVFESFLVAFVAGAAGTSIFASSTISSLTGHCGSSGFFFCSVAFGDGSGGRLGPTCDLETNFCISTSVTSIFHPKFTKMGMIFGVDSYPSVLMSLSKRRALFKMLPRFPTTSWILSRTSICANSWRISSSFFANSTLKFAILDVNVALVASKVDVSFCWSFFRSLQMFSGLQLPKSLQAPLVTNSNLEYYPCS